MQCGVCGRVIEVLLVPNSTIEWICGNVGGCRIHVGSLTLSFGTETLIELAMPFHEGAPTFSWSRTPQAVLCIGMQSDTIHQVQYTLRGAYDFDFVTRISNGLRFRCGHHRAC